MGFWPPENGWGFSIHTGAIMHIRSWDTSLNRWYDHRNHSTKCRIYPLRENFNYLPKFSVLDNVNIYFLKNKNT